jgi:hypothetical protein
MVTCGSYMFEFSVSKDMKKKKDIIKEVAIGKVVADLCLTLIVKKLKISAEHGRVVTTHSKYISNTKSSYFVSCTPCLKTID